MPTRTVNCKPEPRLLGKLSETTPRTRSTRSIVEPNGFLAQFTQITGLRSGDTKEEELSADSSSTDQVRQPREANSEKSSTSPTTSDATQGRGAINQARSAPPRTSRSTRTSLSSKTATRKKSLASFAGRAHGKSRRRSTDIGGTSVRHATATVTRIRKVL